MSLVNIPSALFIEGSGGIAGFLIGFTLKKVMKIAAVIVGLFFGAIIYLQSQSIISVNWDKLQFFSESTLNIGNSMTNTGLVSNITGNLGIPLTGGLSAGLVLGLTKGREMVATK